MTPLILVTELLQSVPPVVRKILLWLWVAAFLVVEVLKRNGVDVAGADDTLGYLGLYLGVQSAVNVPKAKLPPDEYPGGYAAAVEAAEVSEDNGDQLSLIPDSTLDNR